MDGYREDEMMFLTCQCSAHALGVVRDNEYNYTDVTFWHLGYGGNWRTLRQRIAAAWRVLRHGNLFVESVSLSTGDSRKLAHYLLENNPET